MKTNSEPVKGRGRIYESEYKGFDRFNIGSGGERLDNFSKTWQDRFVTGLAVMAEEAGVDLGGTNPAPADRIYQKVYVINEKGAAVYGDSFFDTTNFKPDTIVTHVEALKCGPFYEKLYQPENSRKLEERWPGMFKRDTRFEGFVVAVPPEMYGGYVPDKGATVSDKDLDDALDGIDESEDEDSAWARDFRRGLDQMARDAGVDAGAVNHIMNITTRIDIQSKCIAKILRFNGFDPDKAPAGTLCGLITWADFYDYLADGDYSDNDVITSGIYDLKQRWPRLVGRPANLESRYEAVIVVPPEMYGYDPDVLSDKDLDDALDGIDENTTEERHDMKKTDSARRTIGESIEQASRDMPGMIRRKNAKTARLQPGPRGLVRSVGGIVGKPEYGVEQLVEFLVDGQEASPVSAELLSNGTFLVTLVRVPAPLPTTDMPGFFGGFMHELGRNFGDWDKKSKRLEFSCEGARCEADPDVSYAEYEIVQPEDRGGTIKIGVATVKLSETDEKIGDAASEKRPRTAGEFKDCVEDLERRTSRRLSAGPAVWTDGDGRHYTPMIGQAVQAKGGFAKVMLMSVDHADEDGGHVYGGTLGEFVDMLSELDPKTELVFTNKGRSMEIESVQAVQGMPPEFRLRPWGQVDEGLGDIHEYARALAEDDFGMLR